MTLDGRGMGGQGDQEEASEALLPPGLASDAMARVVSNGASDSEPLPGPQVGSPHPAVEGGCVLGLTVLGWPCSGSEDGYWLP